MHNIYLQEKREDTEYRESERENDKLYRQDKREDTDYRENERENDK